MDDTALANGPGHAPLLSADAEALLVQGAIAGDARAFAELYDLHLARVYRYVYYMVGNRVDAEDVTQQVFLQAWRAVSRYQRTGSKFISWLLVIAHNTVVTHWRRNKKEVSLEDRPALARERVGPEEGVLASLDREAVRRAILRLKPDQQQVVVMRFIEQFDHAEIASALGKSEGNVRVIQHRALGELRRLLWQEVGDK